ncbi:MAG: tyrosine-type recombinase/integrase [Chloroflexota bacterium]
MARRKLEQLEADQAKQARRSRGNGEGSIYQRATDGKWCAAVTLPTGKRKVLYGRTRQDVAAKLTTAIGNKQKGLPVSYERQSVATFLRRWLEESVRPKVRPRTFDSYRFYVERHLIPGLGREQLATLSPQTVQGFLNRKAASRRLVSGTNMTALEGATLAPRTVQYIRAILRKALSQALKWDLVGRNVATLVDPPRSQKTEVQPLTPDQARTFLAAVKGDRLEALFTVAMAMGLRQGEALGLRWADVDFTAGELHVRQTLVRVMERGDDGKDHARLVIAEPKTDRSRRSLHLPAVSVAALHKHRAAQLQERLLAGTRWQDTGLVFTTTIGTPIDASGVTHRFHALLRGADLPRKRFHDLRHTCASLLLAQGLDLRLIMEILGHSQISLTANLYTHVLPAAKADVADRMDALLAPRASAHV